MIKHYVYQGVPIPFQGSKEELEAFLRNNEHLEECECTHEEYSEALATQDGALAEVHKMHKKRRLVEEAVHALLMQFNEERMKEGKELIQPLDDVLGKWLKL